MKIKKATVIATGEAVRVYALKQPINGKGWANYEDGGKTIYEERELKFNP